MIRHRRIVLLACAFLAAASVAVPAQTLDELDRPLLEKGRAAVALDVQVDGDESRTADIRFGTSTYYRPPLSLLPGVVAGLARNLEFRIDIVGQVPFSYSHPSPFAWWYQRDERALLAANASVALRPAPTLELTAGLVLGRSRYDLAYAHSISSNGFDRASHRTTQVGIGVTWLPGSRGETRALRADLDGLHRPQVAPGRWRIDGEVQWRSYRQTSSYSFDTIPDFSERTARSSDARLWAGTRYGLTRGLEAWADAYWHPAFTIGETTQSFCAYCRPPGPRTRDDSTRYRGVFGALLGTSWRIGRAEVSLAGTWERQEVARPLNSRAFDGRELETGSVRVDGTWLSRPPRRTVDRRALAGFDRPLVERGQVKVETGLHHRRHREAGLSVEDTDTAFVWLGAATGLSSSLEIRGQIGRRYARDYMTRGGYEYRTTSGGQVTVRPSDRLQVEAAFDVTPRAWWDRFPMFVLGVHDSLHYYEAFASDGPSGDRSARLGLRLMF